MSKPIDMLLIPRRKIEDAVKELRHVYDELDDADSVLNVIHALEVELERASFLQSKTAGKIDPIGEIVFLEI